MTPTERRALHELAERFRWFSDDSTAQDFFRRSNGICDLVRNMGPMVAVLIDNVAGVASDAERNAAITRIDQEMDDDRAELP